MFQVPVATIVPSHLRLLAHLVLEHPVNCRNPRLLELNVTIIRVSSNIPWVSNIPSNTLRTCLHSNRIPKWGEEVVRCTWLLYLTTIGSILHFN